MTQTFEITHDHAFLRHFLTTWRTKTLSPEMVEKLKADKESDPYAAYGYGRWLSLVNPGGDCLNEAEVLLLRAGSHGVQDANAALAQMYFDGRTEADKAMPEMHAFLMDSSYKQGSELAQFMTLEGILYGEYGFPKDPAQVADILRGHLEKNPGSDPIYYDLLGQALESSDPAAAEKAYRTALERGETESYYSLADLYLKRGDTTRAWETAEEGARHGAVNCHRFKARMNQEDFEKLSAREQEALHQEIAEGLDYAIAHHDGFACYLKGSILYLGELGFPQDYDAALEPLERGCQMGIGSCWFLKAAILDDQGKKGAAYAALMAVRHGDRESFTLEQVAKGYVSGVLSPYAEEIEKLWLKQYVEVNPEEEDSKDSTGVMAVYPQGFYYAMDTDTTPELDTEALAGRVGVRSFDVVHFSPVLTRITRALGLDEESAHVVMLVDKDGYMKDLPDNMPATLVYGQGQEIRGTVVFALEDDKDYVVMPMLGLQRTYMFLQLLNAATGGLVRAPSSEELEAIGADDPGGFEEYDDFEPEQEIEEEPGELTAFSSEVREAIGQHNLCMDTLTVTLPDSREYWFLSVEDLIFKLDIKDVLEQNIARHGGYMIDEWQFVDARQVPMDLRSRVRFALPEKQGE